MPSSNHKNLKQLNSVFDKMLKSDSFRQRAATSGMDVLAVAARLIDATHPQLPVISRHLLHEELMVAVDSQQQIDAVQAKLLDSPQPELNDSQRSRIFDRMMASVPATATEYSTTHSQNGNNPPITDEKRQKMFEPVLDAQRRLQTDALVDSDDALELARSNNDAVVQAAVRLRTAAHPQLTARRKEAMKNRILPQPERERRVLLRPDFSGSLQRVAASIAILIFIAAIGVPPVAAASVPGDGLYPVKRTLESVSLQLAVSPIQEARRHVTHANERLEEFKTPLLADSVRQKLLDDALTSLELASGLVSKDDVALQNDILATVESFSQTVDENINILTDTQVENLVTRRDIVIQTMPVPPQVTGITDDDVIADELEIIATPTPTLEPLPGAIMLDKPERVYLNSAMRVNIRRAPTTTSDILVQVEVEDELSKIGVDESGTWFAVQLEDGRTGWIAAFLLVDVPVTPLAPTESSDTVESTDDDDTPGNSSQSANVDNGGSTGSSGSSTTAQSSGGDDDDDDDSPGNNGRGNGNANGNASGNNNPQNDSDNGKSQHNNG